MKWFKMFSEARNDAKLRTLTDAEFRVWFNLLCLAAEQPERGVINGYSLQLLAVEVTGGDVPLLLAVLDKVTLLRVTCVTGVTCVTDVTIEPEITFLKFHERQYEKPSNEPEKVAERVRRHRE